MIDRVTTELVEKGLKRLISAPKDLRFCDYASIGETHGRFEGSPAHRSLFNEYKEILGEVVDVALDWWAETIEARKQLTNDNDEAIRAAWLSRPAGPASFPGIVALIRDYWLACHEINKSVPNEQRVPPEVFLLFWLQEDKKTQEVAVLSCMPYWPIGLDEHGNWV